MFWYEQAPHPWHHRRSVRTGRRSPGPAPRRAGSSRPAGYHAARYRSIGCRPVFDAREVADASRRTRHPSTAPSFPIDRVHAGGRPVRAGAGSAWAGRRPAWAGWRSTRAGERPVRAGGTRRGAARVLEGAVSGLRWAVGPCRLFPLGASVRRTTFLLRRLHDSDDREDERHRHQTAESEQENQAQHRGPPHQRADTASSACGGALLEVLRYLETFSGLSRKMRRK